MHASLSLAQPPAVWQDAAFPGPCGVSSAAQILGLFGVGSEGHAQVPAAAPAHMMLTHALLQSNHLLQSQLLQTGQPSLKESATPSTSASSDSKADKKRRRPVRKYSEVLHRLDDFPSGTVIRVTGPVSAQRQEGFFDRLQAHFRPFGPVRAVVPVMAEGEGDEEQLSGMLFLVMWNPGDVSKAMAQDCHEIDGLTFKIRKYVKRRSVNQEVDTWAVTL